MSPPRNSAALGGVGKVDEALCELKPEPDERVEKRGHLEEKRDDDDEDQDGQLCTRKSRGVGASTPAMAPDAPSAGTPESWLKTACAKLALNPQTR